LGKDKLKRFIEIATFTNVFEMEPVHKGFWGANYFKNDHPIVLELGCGRGEYTVNLAEKYPNKNFIGIDIKGARIWRGAKTAIENNLQNVAFLRIEIENILDHFSVAEISEIWITFPDPQPQISRVRKRLTSDRFLAYYQSILKPNGIVHLKTDSDALFDYTKILIQEKAIQVQAATTDLYQDEMLDDLLQIQTTYEKKYLAVGKSINYLKFSFE
jgi:tRNA (guanine-N7-)-methyltransferase